MYRCFWLRGEGHQCVPLCWSQTVFPANFVRWSGFTIRNQRLALVTALRETVGYSLWNQREPKWLESPLLNDHISNPTRATHKVETVFTLCHWFKVGVSMLKGSPTNHKSNWEVMLQYHGVYLTRSTITSLIPSLFPATRASKQRPHGSEPRAAWTRQLDGNSIDQNCFGVLHWMVL